MKELNSKLKISELSLTNDEEMIPKLDTLKPLADQTFS